MSESAISQPTPPPTSLGDGIHQIPVPLPFKAPPWVNVYLIEAGDGLLMIDCGTDWEPGRAVIEEGFQALGLGGAPVHTLVVSHLHPDHVGMATRLVHEWGCRFVMHRNSEHRLARYNDTPGYARQLLGLAIANGVPEDLARSSSKLIRPDYMPLIEPPDHVVDDGDEIDLGQGRSLTVMHTPGHEPAHICLRDSRSGAFFSGDHVLPRISPVVMFDPDLGDPLGDYMTSLRRLIKIGIGLTYPAHGTIIEHGDERARQILLHHLRRLSDMSDLIHDDESSAWQVMRQSFRPNLDIVSARLAFLETLSHLEHLRQSGAIDAEDRDGTTIYRRRRLA